MVYYTKLALTKVFNNCLKNPARPPAAGGGPESLPRAEPPVATGAGTSPPSTPHPTLGIPNPPLQYHLCDVAHVVITGYSPITLHSVSRASWGRLQSFPILHQTMHLATDLQ